MHRISVDEKTYDYIQFIAYKQGMSEEDAVKAAVEMLLLLSAKLPNAT